MLIKFKAEYAGQKAGAVVDVDDAIARAYITAGKAEEAPKGFEDSLVASARSEVRTAVTEGMTELRRELTEQLRTLAPTGRPAVQAPAEGAAGNITPGESEDDKFVRKAGFRSLGHYASAVHRGYHPSSPDVVLRGMLDKYNETATRIMRATASGMSEQVDPDGGNAIPPDYNNQIWERVRQMNSVIDRIDMIPIDGNTYRMPADAETSRVDGQRRGGILGYWEGEAAQYAKSKPTLSNRWLRLKKLTVLVFATNELLEDSGAMEGYINRVAPEEITFKLNDALINGSGAGIPLGIMNSPAKVTVAAVSGQGAGTIVGKNVITMYQRLYAPCRSNAVWLCNQDAEAQLQQMSLATGTYSGQLIYMPPTGLSQSPYATLQGRPVIPIEQCQTVGTEGDLILTDLSQVLAIRKRVGLQQSMSIHLRFDYDETVFKFSMRMDAQCAWAAPLTPFKGTNTQSPIITLNSTRT